MDREACWAAVYGVTELDTTEWLSTHTEVLYDPAIPLLHIYPEKMKTLIRNDTGTPCNHCNSTKFKNQDMQVNLISSTVECIKKKNEILMIHKEEI